MSALGMNANGEVRTASEFKDIFVDSAVSHEPYRCPFCEVPYEARCITTVCVKAPHFKLPANTEHINGCNGEAGSDALIAIAGSPGKQRRTVVGEIELPEVLIDRRKAQLVRRPGDDGTGPPPDAFEVARRRKLITSDEVTASRFTTSLLGQIVDAYIRLRNDARDTALKANLKSGTPEYNAKYSEVVNAHPLSLYKQKFTYGKAFQGKHLRPAGTERVYNGRGVVRAENGHFIILDNEKWPTEVKTKDSLVPFEVVVRQAPVAGAPTSHLAILKELDGLAASGKVVQWWAYGLPTLQAAKFELIIDSLDHLYWPDQHKR
ncbi:hypothetical protein [Massilia aquatica]|uniref:Uncharacterized protein n=1 Tax=Massilia aquatica TaxID=2609000 RepID=A0ABX0MBM4_9BURK|nr:hypothetical protein [Massilia aquatica]NHZ44594.1 hypothetical protein [Massilia aquatica]